MSNRKYAHVVAIAIDGAGGFIEKADTPNFDRIFANGAVTYTGLSSNPTVSAECYGAMLLGVGPEVHKLTNATIRQAPHPSDSPIPSVFRRIKTVYPDAVFGLYCDWRPITVGTVEAEVEVSKASARDAELTPMICDYIKSNKPDFLFVQMDSVDGAGHRNGYGTEAHLQRIHEVDELVNDVHKAIEEAGMLEDTLFIVLADHGGTPEGGHGGWTEAEKLVTFAIAGKDVQHTAIEEVNVRDLAAIVLYAFGIEVPPVDEQGWTAQVPEGVWNDASLPEYKDLSHLTGAAPRISKVPHTSELI
jgi:predicted AlkP superfamily pyrophosphatase or phosphodiesterase